MKESVRNWLVEQVGSDDPDLLQTLYDDYRATVDEQLEQARRDLLAGDFAGLDRTAHALKGAVLTVGDQEMLVEVLAMRDAAKASDGPTATAAADRIAALSAALGSSSTAPGQGGKGCLCGDVSGARCWARWRLWVRCPAETVRRRAGF